MCYYIFPNLGKKYNLSESLQYKYLQQKIYIKNGGTLSVMNWVARVRRDAQILKVRPTSPQATMRLPRKCSYPVMVQVADKLHPKKIWGSLYSKRLTFASSGQRSNIIPESSQATRCHWGTWLGDLVVREIGDYCDSSWLRHETKLEESAALQFNVRV